NRYQFKTVRNAIRKFKTLKDKEEASKEFSRLASLIDKLAKRGVIHSNNAANKKSGLARYIAHLS
ncbi:30S ribosomal protein S20, partial [Bacteroidota bacterium]